MRALHQFGAGGSRGGSGSGSRRESDTGRRRGEEAEDEEVRRAIAESLKEAGLHSEDADVEVEDDDENVCPIISFYRFVVVLTLDIVHTRR